MAVLVRLKLFRFPTIITPAEIQIEMKIYCVNSEAYVSGAEDGISLLYLIILTVFYNAKIERHPKPMQKQP